MHDESDFLRALSENPADDALRMIYADWLDERGDERSGQKAQFLRVTVRLTGPITRVGWRHARRKELHELAQSLPGEWLAVVSRLRIENCEQTAIREGLARQGFVFNVVCDTRWDELTATAAPTVRHCGACDRNVYYCDTIEEARTQARRGECVAVNLGVIRQPRDLEKPAIMVGGGGII